jgi:hypothetical protein
MKLRHTILSSPVYEILVSSFYLEGWMDDSKPVLTVRVSDVRWSAIGLHAIDDLE